MRNLIKTLVFISILLGSFTYFGLEKSTAETDQKTVISVFWRKECPHCHEAMTYFESIKAKYPNLEIHKLDLSLEENSLKFEKVATLFELARVTPIIQIDKEIITGFSASYQDKIERIIEKCQDSKCLDLESLLAKKENAIITNTDLKFACEEGEVCEVPEEETFNVPFLGEITAKEFSLPLIATVLGFIDGFNPCAMWVLIMFLTLLAQTGSKKLMIQVAGLFIFAETIMYYLILNVWFTTWDFIGLDKIVTPIIAVVAILAGIYFLYEYIKLPPGVCIIASPKQQKKTHDKISEVIKRPLTIISALSIIGIAFSVNIIEFACSIGIPQTFTKILEINQLSLWTNQLLILLYILFYMVDDFIVFGIALYSFEKIGLTQKYSKYCQLVGGILMIVLGLILLFKREWLVF